MLLRWQFGKKSCIHQRRTVQEDGAGGSENALNETAESESIENIMEEVERMSREAKEGKEEGRKVSPQGAKIRIAHQGHVDITP